MLYEQAVFYLTAYDIYILSALFALVWIFGAANFIKNPYRKQNKKLNVCRNRIVANPKFTWLYVASVPEEYCRQWRAYVNSGADRPSLVFEFVSKKNRLLLLPLFICSAVVSSAYIALFVLETSHREYVVFQVAFWLSFAMVLVVNKLVFARKEKRARQTFGKFVCQLNATRDISQSDDAGKIAKRLSEITKRETGKTALQKASEVLRAGGLENTRTAEQQRQINNALNGLLQAYSRNASRSRT